MWCYFLDLARISRGHVAYCCDFPSAEMKQLQPSKAVDLPKSAEPVSVGFEAPAETTCPMQFIGTQKNFEYVAYW